MEGFCPVKAVRIHEDGGPEVLRYEDAPDPEAGPGEALIRLLAASLNHLDVWVRKGRPSAPKPRILGADGAGTVDAVGERAAGLAPGDRVVLNPGRGRAGGGRGGADRGGGRAGEGDHRGPRRGRRRRARRRGDVGDLAPGGGAGRTGRRVRRDERPEPARGAAPDLVEAAGCVRLDDGDEGRLRRRLRARAERPGATRRRRGLPLGGGARRARAAGGGRAARQDRPSHPGVAAAPRPLSWLTRLPGAPKPPPAARR